MTQYEFTPGCSVRALGRAGVLRLPERRPIACEQKAIGLASKPGKLSQPNSNRPRALSEKGMAAPNGTAAHMWPCRAVADHRGCHASLAERCLAVTNDVKGDIFMRCPTTGQPVPIGFHTGTTAFATLPKSETRMPCPACALSRLSKRSMVELRHGLGRRKRPIELRRRSPVAAGSHDRLA
jgi:hypothetical protein